MVSVCGCSNTVHPVVTPNRLLGMSIDTPNSSMPTQSGLDDATALAMQAGVNAAVVTLTWADLEPQPGLIDLTQLKSKLDYFHGLGHGHGLTCFVGIQVINTVKREVPADLAGTDFAAPAMSSRFHALLDAVRGILTSEDAFLSIGNEVDVYLSHNPAEWAAYQTFYADAVAYVHAAVPGMLVGVTTTFRGYSADSSSQIKSLNSSSDVITLTYYPVGLDQQVAASNSPTTDVPQMLRLADGKPVVIQEAGFPSSAANGSSESMQADFVTNLLNAWRSAGTPMPFLSYFLLYNFDATTCASLTDYYQMQTSPTFATFLCSLGLRHSDGTPKPDWQKFTFN